MELYKEQSIILGVLYLLVFLAGIFSVSKVIDSRAYLAKCNERPGEIYRAAGFQILLSFFYLIIFVILFPILYAQHASLSFGFFGFRALAFTFVLLGAYLMFTILKVSRAYSIAPEDDRPNLVAKGHKIKHLRDIINHAAMIITLCIGSLFMYMIFIQSLLIPVWISVWGILASLIAVVASILVLTKRLDVLQKSYLLLNAPLILQELFFAGWLIQTGLK